MKIGIDARKIGQIGHKSGFMKYLITILNREDRINKYVVYAPNLDNIGDLEENFEFILTKPDFSGIGQFKFSKKIKADKIDQMIFFDVEKPIFWNGSYIAFPWGLEKIFYPDESFSSSFQKAKFKLLVEMYLERARKIFVFTDEMKKDINDKLNIPEEKMFVYHPPLFKYANPSVDVKVNLLHNIQTDYFITYAENTPNDNLMKLISVFEMIIASGKEIHLIVIGNYPANSVPLRDFVVKKNLQNHIHFVGDIQPKEEKSYYQKSAGYIYTNLYDVYPFALSKAVNYEVPILAPNYNVIKSIFDNKIFYFNPLSDLELKEAILKAARSTKQINYSGIYNSFDTSAASIIKHF